jgi:Cu+-exporting ATPase
MEVAELIPRQARQTTGSDGAQLIRVIMRGGYHPCLIRARAGRPLRLVFDRQEDGECTSSVAFPDFGISASLPAFTQTAVEFTPGQAGAFGFSCGMEMIWGILLVEDGEPAGSAASPRRDQRDAGDRSCPAGAVTTTERTSRPGQEVSCAALPRLRLRGVGWRTG